MRKLLVLLAVLVSAEAKAQTVENDLIGLGMQPEVANYLASVIPAGAALDNNVYLKSDNQAGNATINVLKVDTTDDTFLNADSGDVIKLAVAATPVAQVATTGLSFSVSTAGISYTPGTLAAAGSVQGDAAAVADRVTTVTGADATKGVILPASPTAGDVYYIANTAAAVLKIYPGTGDQINATAANTAVSIAASTLTTCIAASASQWWCDEGTAP